MSLKIGNNRLKNNVNLSQLRISLKRYVAGKVRHIQDTDDVVQESLARVCHYADLAELNSPMAYAIQVAKSVLAENYNKAKQFDFDQEGAEQIDQLSCATDYEGELINEEKLIVIQTTVASMPELRRRVFTRRKIDHLSREEIAQEFGLSIAAVKKHINRATVDLTIALQKHSLWENK